MTRNDQLLALPEGIPQGLTAGEVSRILRLRDETVKRALSSGSLPSWQITPGRGWRYVRPQDVATYAAERQLTVYWDELEKF